jgi:hypothetical protein
MVFNASVTNISVITLRSDLLVDERGVSRENHRPAASHIYILTWQSGDGLQTYKTPTTILFDKDGKFCSFGYEAEHDYAKMCENSTHADYRYFSKF